MATQTLVLQVLSKGWGALNRDLETTEINWKKTLSQMGRITSKMTGVMTMMNTAGVDLDGTGGKMISKFLGLASILSAGGPLGVAMAGVAASAMAGKLAYDTWNASTVALENGQRSLQNAFKAQESFHRDQIKTIDDLDKKLRDFGKTQYQVQVQDIQRSIELRKSQTHVLQQDTVNAANNLVRLNVELAKEVENYSVLWSMPSDADRIKKLKDQIKLEEKLSENAARNIERAAEATANDQFTLTRLEMLEAATNKQEAAEARKVATKALGVKVSQEQAALDAQIVAIDARQAILQQNFYAEKNRWIKAAYDAEIADATRANNTRIAAENAYVEKVRAAEDEREKLHNQGMQQVTSIATATAATMGAAFAGLVAGTMTGADAVKSVVGSMLSAVIDAAINMVTAYAASASAASFFSQAGIPVVGPILAVAAAATAGAFVRALAGQIQTAAYGFDQTGGGHAVGGRDSQLVMMDPRRERILDAGRSAQPARGGGLELHLHMSPDAGNKAEAERYAIKTMLPTLRRLYDQGHLGFMARARA